MKQERAIELAKSAGFGDYAYEAAALFQEFARLAEQETLEKAATIAESWRGGKLLLNAGEMTGQEMRTVCAVTQAIGREIRTLKDAP